MENDNFSSTINRFKEILNNSSNSSNNSSNSEDLNISPEMISKLTSILNNNSDSSSNNNSQNCSSNDNSSDDFFSNFDINTILKLKNILTSLNTTDDNNSKLLYSLKPYLNKSRQKKIDQYVKILKISKLSSILKNEVGDKN